ncbi:prephenate dehydratase [Candidatus Latescibacterota bacterium]
MSPTPSPAVTVAVQGELGSNSELAAHEFFGDRPLTIHPCATFAGLFESVAGGDADFGMAPVENSLAGSIHEVWRLLPEHRLPVCGEILLRISHCLISHPGSSLGDICDVYSHPQALAQCHDFLHSLDGARQHEVYDTAGAVKMIKERGVRGEAAIASAQAAVDHGMEIVAGDLETRIENFTRFLVLHGGQAPLQGSGETKTTVVAQLGDRAGALPELLQPLRRRDLEVLKVESAKRLGEPWAYDIYLEFTGEATDGEGEAALREMGEVADQVVVVGSYPAGRRAVASLRRHAP